MMMNTGIHRSMLAVLCVAAALTGACASPPAAPLPTAPEAVPTYAVALTATVDGKGDTLSVACDGDDPLVSGACVSNEGNVWQSGPNGAGAWTCFATARDVAKPATLVAFAWCQPSKPRNVPAHVDY